MTNEEVWAEAEAQAKLKTLKPPVSPVNAAASTAFISGIIVLIYASLCGLNIENHPIAFLTTILICASISYYYYKTKESEYNRAKFQTIDALKLIKDNPEKLNAYFKAAGRGAR